MNESKTIFEVYLTDAELDSDQSELLFLSAGYWAKEHCASFDSYHVMDVSDVSYRYDAVAEYLFTDEKDVTLFTLKWLT